MILVPCTLRQANAFVCAYHRHHGPVAGARVSLAAADEAGIVHGVLIAGHLVARHLHDGWTLEVTRLCTDSTANVCSFLYGAAWRAAQALGYCRIITYSLPEEGGASLRAVGWRQTATTNGGSWHRPSRPRQDQHPLGPKWRWEQERSAPPLMLTWQHASSHP